MSKARKFKRAVNLSQSGALPASVRKIAQGVVDSAQELWRKGDEEGAADELDELIAELPTYAPAHLLLARIVVQERFSHEDIQFVLKRLIEAGCGTPKDELLLAITHVKLKQYEQALPAFERALERDADKLEQWGYSAAVVIKLIHDCEAKLGRPRSALSAVPKKPPVRIRITNIPQSRQGLDKSPARFATTPAPPPKAVSNPAPPAPAPPIEQALPLVTSVVIEETPALLGDFAQGTLSGLSRCYLGLDAVALSHAERFETLLCLGTLQGVSQFAYQIETVRKVLRSFRGRVLLADEVGLGKTIEAGMVLNEYIARGMVKRALILAPPALVSQWCSELAGKFGLSPVSSEALCESTSPAAFWREHDVIVASLALARNQTHAPLLERTPFDLVIVDEAHHVRNTRTAGWKLINGLKSRFLVLISATPVENSLNDLYGLVTLLRPGQLGTPAAFKRRFVERGNPTQPVNRELLRELLGEVMIRNTRALADVKLPPRHATTLLVEASEAERRLYNELVELVRKGFEQGLPRVTLGLLLQEAGSSYAAVRRTLATIAGGEKLGHDLCAKLSHLAERSAEFPCSAKLARLLDIISRSREKVLVFSRFKATLDELERGLAEAGVGHVSFIGGMSAPEKTESVRRFREDVDVMLCSEIGGEGQNLQFCSNIVNYDLPWNPMKIEQRIGRLHRIGQTQPVNVFNLCASGTAEERILDVLDKKINMFELVIGEIDMVLGQLKGDDEFEERVLAIYGTSKDETEVEAGFATLAKELSTARRHYEKIKQLDGAIFNDDYEV